MIQSETYCFKTRRRRAPRAFVRLGFGAPVSPLRTPSDHRSVHGRLVNASIQRARVIICLCVFAGFHAVKFFCIFLLTFVKRKSKRGLTRHGNGSRVLDNRLGRCSRPNKGDEK